MSIAARSFVVACAALACGGAGAEAEERFPPISDPVAQAECSACHMAFPAGLLPERSWRALMADLPNHFGENAQLAPEVATSVEAYLVAHAAAGRKGVLRGLDDGVTPLRITELPWWIREHDEITAADYAKPTVGSKANCAACHKGAAQGVFEDD